MPMAAALLTRLLAGAVEFLVGADCCAAAALLISSNDALKTKKQEKISKLISEPSVTCINRCSKRDRALLFIDANKILMRRFRYTTVPANPSLR